MNDLDIATADTETVKEHMRAWPAQANGLRDYRLTLKLLGRIKRLRPDLFKRIILEWADEGVWVARPRLYAGLEKLGVIFGDEPVRHKLVGVKV